MVLSRRDHPVIVGLGGTARADSSCEKALRFALGHAEQLGAETILLTSTALQLPIYPADSDVRDGLALNLLAHLKRANGVIVASPGYHGSISGLVKNALDYAEDLRGEERPYLEGRSVGCIVSAAGWQAAITTLVTLRGVAHALRGWPTPLGVAINSMEPSFDAEGRCLSPALAERLQTLGEQVFAFASVADLLYATR
jgi:FMN reductase